MLPSHIFLTALAAQFIYILFNWYFFQRREYIFYAIYILSVAAYFSNKYLADDTGIVHLGAIEYHKLYPDKILVIISFFFYFKFARHFVEAETRYPRMNYFMKRIEKFSLVYIIADATLLSLTHNFKLENVLFFLANIFFTVLALIYIFRTMIRHIEVLDRIIFTGTTLYGIGAFITLLVGQNKSSLDENHFLALQIGAIAEMIFLNAGLVYKSRMLQNQTIASQKQLIEKYKENQELVERLGSMREKISRDLHDDVGGELSAIRLLSEMSTPEINPQQKLTKISSYSGEIVQKMNEIVWALNVNNDTLQSLIGYVRRYAVKYLDDIGIGCIFKQPDTMPEMEVDGATRRNIFLLVKEALHNIVKHAQAAEVNITVEVSDQLKITVHDNGKGIPEQLLQSKTGNGLRNMQQRIEDIKGNMEIINHDGTTVLFTIPFMKNNTKG
jgi:signal transduction histidine kinase